MSGKSVELRRLTHLRLQTLANLAVWAETGCPLKGLKKARE